MSENSSRTVKLFGIVSNKPPSKIFKHPRVAHNGFLYHFHKQCKRHLRWKCNRVFAMKCPCVLRTSMDIEDLRIIGIDHEHVHPIDTTSIAILKLKIANPESPIGEQSILLEITDNDVIKTTSDKRSHESESTVNNKKLKYSASDQGYTNAPSHDNGKDLKLTHVNFNNTIVVEEINKQPEIVETCHFKSNTNAMNNKDNKIRQQKHIRNTRSNYKNIKTYSNIHKKIFPPRVEDTVNIQNDFLLTQIDQNIININNSNINDIKLTPDDSNKKKVDSEYVLNIKTNDKKNCTIFTKENWPDMMNKLNDSSKGLKLFESILLKKMIFHIIYSGVLAEYQTKLDKYKRRESYWKSKFKLLSRKMKKTKRDITAIAMLHKSYSKPQAFEKNTFIQMDIQDNQAEQLSHEMNEKYLRCQQIILNNQKHLTQTVTNTTNIFQNKITESNYFSTSIDLNTNIQPYMEISKLTPQSEISQNSNSVIQKYIFTSDISISTIKEFIEGNLQISTEYNTQTTSKYLIEPQILINSNNEFTKRNLNHTNSSFNIYKLLDPDKNSTSTIMLQKSHDITSKKNTDEERFVYNSSIICTQIKNCLPDICQNIENVYTIDLTVDSDATIGDSTKSKHTSIIPPILLMTDNMSNMNINSALPIPKLEVKLNTCNENTSLNILLTWTHNLENNIKSYEIYSYALIKDDTIHNPWKLLGKLAALPLPMTVLLKLEDVQCKMYYFSVRAKDKFGNYSQFSVPVLTPET